MCYKVLRETLIDWFGNRIEVSLQCQLTMFSVVREKEYSWMIGQSIFRAILKNEST